MENLTNSRFLVTFLLLGLSLQFVPVYSSGSDLTSDFKVPEGINATTLDGDFFTFTGFRNFSADPVNFPFTSAKRADLSSFPVLDGLDVSITLIVAPTGTLTPVHIHPRGSELVFVLEGTIDIGFVDSTDKLRSQTLKQGDMFVVPKGMVHFQANNYRETVKTINTFGSSRPGVIGLPINLFGSGTADDILKKSFGVDANIIDKLQLAQGIGSRSLNFN